MTTLNPDISISKKISQSVQTNVASHDELTYILADKNEYSEKWDYWIDNYLIEWGRNPGLFDTAEIEPPTKPVILLACRLARESRNAGVSPPLRIVPDGDGGISFERKSETDFQSLNILAEGIVELLSFENRKLVSKKSFAVPLPEMD